MPWRRKKQGDFSKNNFCLFSSCLAKQWKLLSCEIIPASGLNPLGLKGPLAMFLAQNKRHSPHAVSSSASPQATDSHYPSLYTRAGSPQHFSYFLNRFSKHCCKALSETASGDGWIFAVTLSIGAENLVHGHVPILPSCCSSILLPFDWNPMVSTTSSGSGTPAIKTRHDRYGRD